jgi:hypothetical protein
MSTSKQAQNKDAKKPTIKNYPKITNKSNKNRNPLRVVPHDQGFHFYISIGDYCGVTAHSLEEFVSALQYVCSESIIFHFERGDFQKWIRQVLGDSELAQTIDDIKMCERHLSVESCRKELMDILKIRISQLETGSIPKFSTPSKNNSPKDLPNSAQKEETNKER